MRRTAARVDQGLEQGRVRHAAYPRELSPTIDTEAYHGFSAEPEQPWYTQQQTAFDGAVENEWSAAFLPAPGQWAYLEEEAENQATFHEEARYETGQMPDESAAGKPSPISLLVIVVSLLLIGFSAAAMMKAYGEQPAFESKLSAMRRATFFDGILVDGFPLDGLTPGQVRQSLGSQGLSQQQLSIRLIIDGTEYPLDSSHIPFTRNTESVLEEAWSIGRQGSPSLLGSSYTPFETRWQQTRHVGKSSAVFYTEVSYDARRVDGLADALAGRINREPVNAVVSSFDFETRKFTVTQDVPGKRLPGSAIALALRGALDRKDYQAVIRLESETILPRVSSVDLTNRFTKLASFSTRTSSDDDRNNNIALAARSITNRTLMPGEVFSFNESTGQRTIQKGYRGAPAIQGGVLIDDVGGGVCQVSSTLFYAAAASGMEIVERSPHAWPVSYMDKGLDATVNWPNLDFKFRNGGDTPVFIIADYGNRKLTVEFYGMLGAPGESIQLQAELISSTEPPGEPIMQQNPSLPPYTQRELKQARTGYVVDTYRVYLRDGYEVRREKLFTSRYREVQQVIEYN